MASRGLESTYKCNRRNPADLHFPDLYMSASQRRASRTAFAACHPVTANAAALELRAAAGRIGIAFGSTGVPVQFPLPRHWLSPARVGRVKGSPVTRSLPSPARYRPAGLSLQKLVRHSSYLAWAAPSSERDPEYGSGAPALSEAEPKSVWADKDWEA